MSAAAVQSHLDGNAVAGLLAEVFVGEVTSVERTCGSCGTVAPLGAHRAYRGAGIVLRCPRCEDVALVVGLGGDRRALRLTGAWRF